MNHRDRALAAMRGQPVDRIPFIARMDLWYGYHHNRGELPQPNEKARWSRIRQVVRFWREHGRHPLKTWCEIRTQHICTIC